MTTIKAYSAGVFIAMLVIAAIAGCGLAVAYPSAGESVGTIKIPFPESDVVVWGDGEGLCRFTGTGLQYLSRTGEPEIPSQWVRVLLPPDADPATVQAAVADSEWTVIDGEWDVPPVGPLVAGDCEDASLVSPAGEAAVNVRDAGIYESDALFPAEPVVKVDVQVYRGWKMAQVFYAPLAYNPVDREILRLSGSAIEVAFDTVSLRTSSAGADLSGADTVRDMTVNYAAMAGEYGGYAVSADSGRYVIITTSAIQSASTTLADFVASKEARGFKVQVVTEAVWQNHAGNNDTGDAAAEHIRSWLRANFLTAPTIEYVLLIGNPNPASGDVPMKMCYPQTSDPAYPECPTDFYYAELTENWDGNGNGKYGEYAYDFGGSPPRAAEVAVGRIPYYGSIADLDYILGKIIGYENAPAASVSWRTNVLLPMKPSDNVTPGYQLGEEIKTSVLDPSSWANFRIYDDNYSLSDPPDVTPCNVSNVTTAWNGSDFGAVFWWTHGESTSATGVMNSQTALTMLEDDAHPAFTFQCSCLNGNPDVSNNLGYSLLKNGAVSTVSASRVSWYEEEQTSFAGTATNSGMTFEYASRLIGGKMYAGDALNGLKADVLIGSGNDVLWMNYLDFSLYGDPAVGLYSSSPDQDAPSVVTYDAGNVDLTSATLRANLTSMGTADNVTVSFEWGGTSGEPYPNFTDNKTMTDEGPFSAALTGLLPGTTYYYRAKATGDGVSYSYGMQRSFDTLSPPSVVTSTAGPITGTSARLNGILSNRGTADSVTVSFVWGTASGDYPNPTADQTKTVEEPFYSDLAGLTPGTTYYYRARADGDGDPVLGEEVSFTTPKPPTVTTTAAALIAGTSARLNGWLDDRGTADNVTVSFEWRESGGSYAPIAAGVMSSTGTFSADLTGLRGKTTYYFRAKAVGDGTAYGSDESFVTLTIPPSVSTDDPSLITAGGARLNGILDSVGTAGSVSVSFRYGTSPGSYGAETIPEVKAAGGAFFADLSGLANNTTFYYQAKAVGDGPPVYGSEMSFTTGKTTPTVATNAAASIGATSAILNGYLSDLGTATTVVTVYFRWGTAFNGVYPNKTSDQLLAAPGDFSADLSGLSPGTTYYFVARAVGDGAGEGVQRTFTTLAQPPAVTGVTPSGGKMGQSLEVTIMGTGFTGATAVSFGGSDVFVDDNVTVESDTQIRAKIRITCDGTAGNRDVSVTGPGGTGTSYNGFTVSKSAPDQPVNQAPADGDKVVTLTPTLGSSAFSHSCQSRTHAASRWQVRTESGDYAKPIFDSGIDVANLTSILLPDGALDYHVTYFWRVGYRDDQGAWSDWSAETAFIRLDFLSGALSGPAAIRASDSSSRVTGVVDSRTEQQIPSSQYWDGTVTIISPADTYVWEVVGTGEGKYTLTVTRAVDGEGMVFHAEDIPVAMGELHRYVIDWEALSQGGMGATVEIDADGDGTFERTVLVGSEASGGDFATGTSDSSGIPPWAWAVVAISVVAGIVAVLVLWRMDRSKRQKSEVA